ncbi:hypothetical protein BY458DRAFT_518353 [Sporodiniella umbellata]|nr:hypothetical protein BY458DRAFT_518353 [Sporodiniella umbellata]
MSTSRYEYFFIYSKYPNLQDKAHFSLSKPTLTYLSIVNYRLIKHVYIFKNNFEKSKKQQASIQTVL